MAKIDCTGWKATTVHEHRFLPVGDIKLPVYIRFYEAPNDNHAMVYPAGRLSPDHWRIYLSACRAHGKYSPDQRVWVFSKLALDKATEKSGASAPPIFTKEDRENLKAKRALEAAEFDRKLAELSALENVPEEKWGSYSYPPHLTPVKPEPTALQRIVVSRYWNQPAILLGASVGAGKSRMSVDILNARALAPTSPKLRDSVRITLLIAPLSLHENWVREFAKWRQTNLTWRVHKYKNEPEFWVDLEKSGKFMFDQAGGPKAGGIVIICTHQSLSRRNITKQLALHKWEPGFIVVDEMQRFFRKCDNAAYHELMKLRKRALGIVGLSGTPVSRFGDWHSLEEMLAPEDPTAHWKGAALSDYEKLGDAINFKESGLWDRSYVSYERVIKEFHADRISKGRIFMADKNYYMKDALPSLEQQEVGQFADMRLSFPQMFEDEAWSGYVKAAYDLQMAENPKTNVRNPQALASTLLLRMQQLASVSSDNEALLKQFVDEFLDKDEPCVFWTLFNRAPAEELPNTVRYLSSVAPTAWIMGGMTEKDRWRAIDAFQTGSHRFLVAQCEAGGVGLNLTRACKCLFLSIPFGYLSVTQCIGRQHRIGQTQDVTSYFAMTSPIAAFARSIYDRRVSVNEAIPSKIVGLLSKLGVDTPATEPQHG